MRNKIIQPDNPVLRAEITYQQRIVPRWLQWFDRFGVIVVALIISLAILIVQIMDDLYGTDSLVYSNFLNIILALLWITQLVVILRCILAGVNTTGHHRAWQQRDIIALTGISRRQVLMGKFWGALYPVRGWFVAFGIINLAVLALVSTNMAVYCYRAPLEWLRGELHSYYYTKYESVQDYVAHMQAMYCPDMRTSNEMGMLVIHTTAVSVLGIMAATAIGLIGGLIGNQAVGFTVALLWRLAPVVIFTLFPDYPYANGYLAWRWYEYTWFSLADGGVTGILRAGLFRYGLYGGIHMSIYPALLAFWAAIIMYIVYIVFAFLISNFLLRRQGFLATASK